MRLRPFGDPILKQRAEPVGPDVDLAPVIASMRFALKVHDGLGLSPQQIGSTQRVCLMVLEGVPRVCINLEILERSAKMQPSPAEGCLSVTNASGVIFRRDMQRHARVVIRYEDEHRVPQTRELTGLSAIIAQHEFDHLEGKCIADGTTREDRKEFYRANARPRR